MQTQVAYKLSKCHTLIPVVIAGILNLGCTGSSAQVEQKVAPRDLAVSDGAPRESAVTAGKTGSGSEANVTVKAKTPAQNLTLELTYSQRVLVPRGSLLAVQVSDAKSQPVFTRNIKTKTDAPPYTVVVPVKGSAVFPLTVKASLQSPVGHKFSRTVELAKSEQPSAPVEIKMALD
jgi:hypothetical protein